MKIELRHHVIFVLVMATVFITDQITKTMARDWLYFHDSISLAGDYLRLSYVENTGAAFGIFRERRVFLIVVSVLAVIWILWYYLKLHDKDLVEMTVMAMIIGGAAGNLYDRLFHGYVVDFFDVGINRHRWPAFNIADMSISVSICLWLGYGIWKDMKTKKTAEEIPISHVPNPD